MKTNSILIIAGSLLFGMATTKAQTKSQGMKNIDLAGLIVDSETLKPIEKAKIYDESGSFAVTDSDGYFRTRIPYMGSGEVRLTLKVKKEGYDLLEQQEHWGGGDNLGAVFYFGLSQLNSDNDSFSEMLTDLTDTSYPNVRHNFESVKTEIELEKKIEKARKGNDKVFFEIDNAFYIVNDSGWIKLKTKEDNISIDGEKVVSASQINALVKRGKVKGMTPIVSDVASVKISTL